jgi:hypothetical protein
LPAPAPGTLIFRKWSEWRIPVDQRLILFEPECTAILDARRVLPASRVLDGVAGTAPVCECGEGISDTVVVPVPEEGVTRAVDGPALIVAGVFVCWPRR